MDYIIRFAQSHDSFREAEVAALAAQIRAEYAPRGWDVSVQVKEYRAESPFCVVRFVVKRGGGGRGRGGRDWRVRLGVEREGSGRLEEGDGRLGDEIKVRVDGGRDGDMRTVNAREEALEGEKGNHDDHNNEDEDEDENGGEKMQDLMDRIARSFIARSIQAKAIYECWGSAHSRSTTTMNSKDHSPPDEPPSYDNLHSSVRSRSSHLWPRYKHVPSFKFGVDSFMGKHSEADQHAIINSFSYLGWQGKVRMKKPAEEWCIMEEWIPQLNPRVTSDTQVLTQGGDTASDPNVDGRPARLIRLFFGRKVGVSRRHLIEKHDLKKRPYISTTSMDAELALMTANLTLAGPGKLFLDPFCGTGGFMVAAAELGAYVMGCDIDGRSYRGKKGRGVEGGVGSNFKRYGLKGLFGDCFTADLVNTPLQLGARRWIDGIISDPPYGVREGLKVLGSRKTDSPVNGEEGMAASKQPHLIDGVPAHLLPGFIAPKKPYSFQRMLDDILDFAARTLVDGGRLAFWMPSANENEFGEEEVTLIPRHDLLKLMHECVQPFNKWSRRLLVYQRLPGEVDDHILGVSRGLRDLAAAGTRADDLNTFRKRYFQSFADKPNG